MKTMDLLYFKHQVYCSLTAVPLPTQFAGNTAWDSFVLDYKSVFLRQDELNFFKIINFI